jgi:hypothetical protein
MTIFNFMSFIVGIVVLAVGIAGFIAGYGLRSYLSNQRRRRARRARFDIPGSGRTLDPPEDSP